MPRSFRSIVPFLLALLLSGCLPSSCRREEPRALFPSDSLSRRIASETPVDTLRLLARTNPSGEHALEHPRTALFGPGGRLYVADTERNSIFTFSETGALVAEVTSDSFSYPYLAGLREDTVLVFNPGAHRIDFLVGDRIARSIPTPDASSDARLLQYAVGSSDAVYFKAIGDDTPGYIARLDARGRVHQRHPLPGPPWRHAGLLRVWGDSLLSLSGFRPVVDVITPGGRLDTMALVGFDSPMQARSRSFVLGSIEEPPLLSASAAPAGDFLFVLNLRPGWVRIDAYDHSGRLRHVLVQDHPVLDRRFFPVDLAVCRHPDGYYTLAVAATEPEPAVRLYRWQPPR